MGGILRAGDALGPFILERQIAIGGMAEVWAATKASSGPRERFALKVLREVYSADAELRAMVLDEAKIARRLRHPNIVEVEGAYEDGGRLFQAMELLRGKDLRRVLAGAVRAKVALPVPLAIVIARDVARALGYAHSARSEDGVPLEIVHRDVSPHNVMIASDGWVKVLDFGIARAKERLTKTAAGIIKGKLAYMAPEQALAEPVSPKTDVYALGIVLWETLAMRRLFRAANDADLMRAVCESKIPPIRELNAAVPEALAELVSAMLALRPRSRPESMRVVEDGLSRVLFKHFSEDEASLEALSAWARPFLAEPRRRTAVLPEVDDESEPGEPRAERPARTTAVETKDVAEELSDERPPFQAKPTTPEPRIVSTSASESPTLGLPPVSADPTEQTPLELPPLEARVDPTVPSAVPGGPTEAVPMLASPTLVDPASGELDATVMAIDADTPDSLEDTEREGQAAAAAELAASLAREPPTMALAPAPRPSAERPRGTAPTMAIGAPPDPPLLAAPAVGPATGTTELPRRAEATLPRAVLFGLIGAVALLALTALWMWKG